MIIKTLLSSKLESSQQHIYEHGLHTVLRSVSGGCDSCKSNIPKMNSFSLLDIYTAVL